jgi:hypothetical protein
MNRGIFEDFSGLSSSANIVWRSDDRSIGWMPSSIQESSLKRYFGPSFGVRLLEIEIALDCRRC